MPVDVPFEGQLALLSLKGKPLDEARQVIHRYDCSIRFEFIDERPGSKRTDVQDDRFNLTVEDGIVTNVFIG